jgi:putative spermidine/putrescine transport system substrate-binding protein
MLGLRTSTVLTLSAAALVGGLAIGGAAQAQERKVVAVSWGGNFQEAQRKQWWDPYTKETGVKVLDDTWTGEFAKIKTQVEAKNVTWDIISADYDHAIQGCELGLLVEIPDSLIGDKNDYWPRMLHKCGISTDIVAGVMVWDSGRIPASWGGKTPKSIKDTFDTQTFPGKRAMRKRAKNLVEQVLMGDGVDPKRIYEVIDKEKGLDRFFAKATAMKNDFVFFDKNTQALQLLGDGEAAFCSTFNGRVYAANKDDGKKFVIIWDGAIHNTNTYVILKGPRVDEAMKLAAYTLKPDVIARFSNVFPYGPSRKSAMQYIKPDMVQHMPTAPENVKTAIVRNEEWWADNLQSVQEKVNAWLAKL